MARGRSMTRSGARRSRSTNRSSSRGTRGSYRASMSGSRDRPASIGPFAGMSGAMRPYSFKRRWYNSAYNWNVTNVNGFWNTITFAMNQVPNISEYQSLFREYKINRIKATFVPRYDGADQTGAGTGAAKALITYRVVGPENLLNTGTYNQSSLNALLESGAKTRVFNKPISVYFKPTLARDVNDAVVAQSGPTWMRLPTASGGPAAVHHGVSFYVHFNGFTQPTAAFTTDVYYTFYFQLRNPA